MGMAEPTIYNYYIKKSTDKNYPSEANYTGEAVSCIFEGLKQGINYDIKVTTRDYVGNLGTGELKNVTTAVIPDGVGDGTSEGAIQFSGLTWNNHKATVMISKTTSDDYEIEYKVINAQGETVREYERIASGSSISNLNLGEIVIARLTDGINYG